LDAMVEERKRREREAREKALEKRHCGSSRSPLGPAPAKATWWRLSRSGPPFVGEAERNLTPVEFLVRHLTGDWGELPVEDTVFSSAASAPRISQTIASSELHAQLERDHAGRAIAA
jgi:hypothetical protein